MKLLADTLAAALVLEEAAHKYSQGDSRKMLVAERFISRHFSPPPKRGILANADRSNVYFAELVSYQSVILDDEQDGALAAS